MSWADKRVFITGAAGFIGSHLAEELLDKGAKVHCLTRYNSRNDIGNLKYINKSKFSELEIVRGDLRSEDTFREILKEIDIVFHLGALISIPYSYRNPTETIYTNVMGTLNLLNACRSAGIEKIVHTSTSEVYGTAQSIPIDENHPLVAQSPYSASKIGADMIALSYYYSYGLPVSVIRPFNTFGPGQSTRAVIPTIITQALSGSIVKLGDISTTRDFTFVKDTVSGFLKVAENDVSIGKIMNIGSGFEISIEHIVKHIGNILGEKIKIETEELRKRPEKSEVMRLIADNSRAKELIGWEPHYTFEDGLRETVEWYKNNLTECYEENYNI